MSDSSNFWMGNSPGVLVGRIFAGRYGMDPSPSPSDQIQSPVEFRIGLPPEEQRYLDFYKQLDSVLRALFFSLQEAVLKDLVEISYVISTYLDKALEIEKSLASLSEHGNAFPYSLAIPYPVYQKATQKFRNINYLLTDPYTVFYSVIRQTQWINSNSDFNEDMIFFTEEECGQFRKILNSLEDVPLTNPKVIGQTFTGIKTFEPMQLHEARLILRGRNRFLKKLKKEGVTSKRFFTWNDVNAAACQTKYNWLSPYIPTALTACQIEDKGTKKRNFECYGLPILYFRFDEDSKNYQMLGEFKNDYPEIYSFLMECLEKRIPGFEKKLTETPFENLISFNEVESIGQMERSFSCSMKRALVKELENYTGNKLPAIAVKQLHAGNFYPVKIEKGSREAYKTLIKFFDREESILTDPPECFQDFALCSCVIWHFLSLFRAIEQLYGLEKNTKVDDIRDEFLKTTTCINAFIADAYVQVTGRNNEEVERKRKIIHEKMPTIYLDSFFQNFNLQKKYYEELKELGPSEDAIEKIFQWSKEENFVSYPDPWPKDLKTAQMLERISKNNREFKKSIDRDPCYDSGRTREELLGELEEAGYKCMEKNENGSNVLSGKTRTYH